MTNRSFWFHLYYYLPAKIYIPSFFTHKKNHQQNGIKSNGFYWVLQTWKWYTSVHIIKLDSGSTGMLAVFICSFIRQTMPFLIYVFMAGRLFEMAFIVFILIRSKLFTCESTLKMNLTFWGTFQKSQSKR